MALSGIPIDPQQCIGDSLIVLNNSFIELDSRTLNLSSITTTVSQTLTSSLNSNYNKLKFTATGASDYSVSSLVGSQTNAFLYRVDINGVSQEPGTNVTDGDYYLSGGNLFFSSAPITGTKIVLVGPTYV
jgi:hypothetical protein